MNVSFDRTENTTINRYGYGVAALDMNGRFRELAGTVPLSPRKPVRASCKKPWRGDRELDPIGKYDKTLEVECIPHDVAIESEPPLWWFAKHGEYPHSASIAAVKQFFGFSVEDKRKLFDHAPKSSTSPARYDLFVVRDYLKQKGVI